MLLKKLKNVVMLVALAAIAASAQFLYPNYMMPKVDAPNDSVLQRTWRGVKETLVDAYPQPGTTARMVHRPKSNFPHDAVSEGISYGMFLALYMNDQAYFNRILEGGETWMWNNGAALYDWRRDRNGNNNPAMGAFNNGPASDADQDIALLLIFADRLAAGGVWQAYNNSAYPHLNADGYAGRARRILTTIRESMIAKGRYLMPGGWGGEDPGTINPGYFAPAFYRVFAEFDSENRGAWENLIDGSYELIARSPGYSRGLLPDWCTFEGGTTGGAGYNAYRGGDAMYRDAIRVYWRLATDYLWYKEPRAKTFLDNAMTFLEGKGGPAAADFFEMDGSLLPERDVEVLAMGSAHQVIRSRREHSHLTLGMWAAAAMGSGGPALAQKYSDALLGFYEGGTYWGRAVDPTGGRTIANAVDVDGNEYTDITVKEDTLHNEMYFDQFLAWFGASILAGNFVNVWEDLRDGEVPTGPPTWKSRPDPVLSNWNIGKEEPFVPFRLGASFTSAANWTVTLRHDELGNTRTLSGRSDSVDVVWYGLTEAGAFMPQGWYTLTIDAVGLVGSPYKTQVWLGRPYSDVPNLLRANNRRLLVDDFADNDKNPYIGQVWETYADGYSTAPITVSDNRLTWSHTVNTGAPYPFVTLDWTAGGQLDFRNGVVDTLIIAARSQKAGLGVSLQLLSSDFSASEYQYFEDSLRNMGTAPTIYRIPLSSDNFRQRVSETGKSFETTMSTITGIRFHVQVEPGSEHATGAIIIDSVLFAGSNVATLYTPPPEPIAYAEPDREPEVRVVHRAARNNRYSIRRSANMVRISLPNNMANANVVIVDIKGRTVRRMNVAADARLNITTRGLAAGMYFVDIRKPGVTGLKLPITVF